ncbi:hypothetical protein EV363DRAFT_1211883 [Boletus edulis]|nr:hypothetical protein EV363DRAFT_1211883 [Boletus edulis]
MSRRLEFCVSTMRTFYVLAGVVATAYAAYQYFVANDQDDDRPPRPPPPVHRLPIRPQTYESSQTYEPSQPPVHRPPIRPQTYEYSRTYDSSQPPVHRPPSPPQTYEYSRTYESFQPPVHRPPSPPQTYEYLRTYEPSQPPVHRPPSPPQTYEYSRTYESFQPPVHRPLSPPQTYEYSRTNESSQPPVHRPPSPPQTYEYSQTYEPSQPPVHRPPSPPPTYEYSRTYESSQPPVHRHDEQQQRQIIDSSQRDDITPNAAYASLRARTKQESDLISQCYQQSKEAYERDDLAKALSDEGKHHEREMETLDAEASAIIFEKNNRGRDARKVDLHGLSVKQAIIYAVKAVSDARRSGYSEVRLIVGQGNHSEGGIARLKPALKKDMQRRGHHVKADRKNRGVLVVQLGDS